jgi:hypothetical protein
VADVDVGEQGDPQPAGRAQGDAERGEDALVLVAHGDPGRRHDEGLPAGAFLGPEQLLELGQPTDQPDVEVGTVRVVARAHHVPDDGGHGVTVVEARFFFCAI